MVARLDQQRLRDAAGCDGMQLHLFGFRTPDFVLDHIWSSETARSKHAECLMPRRALDAVQEAQSPRNLLTVHESRGRTRLQSIKAGLSPPWPDNDLTGTEDSIS